MFLVAILTLAPALQGHAAATHPGFAVQQQHEYADAQRADCCVNSEGTGHVLDAECSTCVLPCMSALHALIPDPSMSPFFMSASLRLLVGQVMGGLAAAPYLRPPKTRS